MESMLSLCNTQYNLHPPHSINAVDSLKIVICTISRPSQSTHFTPISHDILSTVDNEIF
jgi:hypothetical protein